MTLNVIVSVDAGVTLNLKFPELLSASNVACAPLSNIDAYWVKYAVDPSWKANISNAEFLSLIDNYPKNPDSNIYRFIKDQINQLNLNPQIQHHQLQQLYF